MNTCQSCKHWMPSEDWDVKAGGLRRCGAVKQKWVVEDEVPHELREGKYGFEGDEDQKTAAYFAAAERVFAKYKAVVMDGSQYRADLLTRPDFGCILHEQQG